MGPRWTADDAVSGHTWTTDLSVILELLVDRTMGTDGVSREAAYARVAGDYAPLLAEHLRQLEALWVPDAAWPAEDGRQR